MPRKSQFTEEQIIRALKEVEAGATGTEVCRRLGVSEQTFYRWKAKFGGMDVSDAQRLRALEEENRKLKLLLAEQLLGVQMLRSALKKMSTPATRRRVASEVQAEFECSQRRCCRALGFARSSVLYRSRRQEEPELVERLKALPAERPRLGDRRLHRLLGD